MTPDRPPRHYPLDPDPDLPCPPPAWVAETVERARIHGLHPTQREGIYWLLAETELRDAALPELGYTSRTRHAPLTLWWSGNGRWLRVEMSRGGGGWRCHLTLYKGNDMEDDRWPRHPANLLRSMLARVFPA